MFVNERKGVRLEAALLGAHLYEERRAPDVKLAIGIGAGSVPAWWSSLFAPAVARKTSAATAGTSMLVLHSAAHSAAVTETQMLQKISQLLVCLQPSLRLTRVHVHRAKVTCLMHSGGPQWSHSVGYAPSRSSYCQSIRE
jgi:hypothetical protein